MGEGHGHGAATVSEASSGYATERSFVSFAQTFLIAVRVDWDASPRAFRLTVRQLGAVNQPVQLYIGSRRLGVARPGRAPQLWQILLPRWRRQLLGSFRYTVRHGAQLAQNFYRYRRQQRRFAATVRLIRGAGLRPNSDLTAPVWGRGVQLSDEFAFDEHEAYADCAVSLTATPLACPYRSKVCATSPSLYIWLSHYDPLATTVEALHVLERRRSPDYDISNFRLPIALPVGADPRSSEPSTTSPRATAAHVESLYRATGFGIPRCVPGYCDGAVVSGIRTFEFGALEAMLGYVYHDRISRDYADAVAALALEVQVGHDAVIQTDRGSFYRPAAEGSFYYAWDKGDRADLDASPGDKVVDQFNMPPEYTGILVSNAETTITAYAFLVDYRCVRYRIGCDGSSAWATASGQ